jgi:hypothetical protein
VAATKRAARQKAVKEAAIAVAEKPDALPAAEPTTGGLPSAFPGDDKEPDTETVQDESNVFDFTVADNTNQDRPAKKEKPKAEAKEEPTEEETEEVAEEEDKTEDTAEETDAGEEKGEVEEKFEIDDDLKGRIKEWGLKDADVDRFESADELDTFLNRMEVNTGLKATKPEPKQEPKKAEEVKPLDDPAEFKIDLELDPDETDPAVIKTVEAMKKATAHLQQQNKDLRDHLVAMNEAAQAQAAQVVANQWDEGIKQLDDEFRVLLGDGRPANSIDINSAEGKSQNELLVAVKAMAEVRASRGLSNDGMLPEMQRRAAQIVFEKQVKAKAQEAKNEKKAQRHSQKTRRPVGQRKGGPVKNAVEAAVEKIKDHSAFKGMPTDEPDDVLSPMGL